MLRLLGTCVQLCYSICFMGICMYAPSLALNAVTNISTQTSMIILTTVCTFYITIVSNMACFTRCCLCVQVAAHQEKPTMTNKP